MGASVAVPLPRLVRARSRIFEAAIASSKNISKKSPIRNMRIASGWAAFAVRYCRNIGVWGVSAAPAEKEADTPGPGARPAPGRFVGIEGERQGRPSPWGEMPRNGRESSTPRDGAR
jgi:hypothetical protein